MSDHRLGDAATSSRRALTNTASNYVGQIVSLGSWFFLTPFILARVGDTDFGLWMLVSSVMAVGQLLDAGIADAVTKYVAEYLATGEVEKAHNLVASALRLYTAIGSLVVLAGAVLAPVFPTLFNIPPERQTTAMWLVLLASLNVGVSTPAGTTLAVLRGLHRFDVVNLISICATIVQVTASVAVLYWEAGIIGLAAVAVAVRLLRQIPSVWAIYRLAPELRFGWRRAGHSPEGKRQADRTVLSFSWPIAVQKVGGYLESEADSAVIGRFLPVGAVAPYASAQKLSAFPQMVAEQFLKLLLPMASEIYAQRDLGRLRSLYVTSTRLAVAVLLPFSLVLMILAGPILSVWLGDAYVAYADSLSILVLAGLIDILTWPAYSVLQAMSRHTFPSIMSVIAGVTNLVLSILLVRSLGPTGVAVGTLVHSTVFALVATVPYTLSVVQVKVFSVIRQALLPALLPAVPSAIATVFLREWIGPASFVSLAFVAGVGFLVYLAGYLGWVYIRRGDGQSELAAGEFERQVCRQIVSRASRTLGRVRTGSGSR